MLLVIKALILALGQLSDPRVVRVMAKSLILTLIGFVGLGIGLYFGLSAGFAHFGLSQSGLAGAAGAALIALIAFWLLFRLVAMAALQFYADEVVIAVETRHYPAAIEKAEPPKIEARLAAALKSALFALGLNLAALPIALLLLFTAIGPALVFIAINSILLGRELTQLASERHLSNETSEEQPNRMQRVLLGGAVAAMMTVPLVNLLAPIVGAAAATHLVQRSRLAENA